MGIRVSDEMPGNDLYSFLNHSSLSDHIRDVETSPNPDETGYYYVFFEIDRKEESLDIIRKVIKDVGNVTTDLKWKASTHLTDKFFPLFGKELEKVFISDPSQYKTRDEWQAEVDAEQEQEKKQEKKQQESLEEAVLKFFESSYAFKTEWLGDNILEMTLHADKARLRVVGFGNHQEMMEQFKIDKLPLERDNINMIRFNRMLGESHQAVTIGDYIVIVDQDTSKTIVSEQC